MLKTRVNNGSIYDWFTEDYRDKFQKVMLRVIKRDGMYNYSKCIPNGSTNQFSGNVEPFGIHLE